MSRNPARLQVKITAGLTRYVAGDRVRIPDRSVGPKRGIVREVVPSPTTPGMVLYALADGGLFGESELESDSNLSRFPKANQSRDRFNKPDDLLPF